MKGMSHRGYRDHREIKDQDKKSKIQIPIPNIKTIILALSFLNFENCPLVLGFTKRPIIEHIYFPENLP